MIYVVLNSGHSIFGHIGDPTFSTTLKTLSPNEVVEVQADGHELARACTILNREVHFRVFRFFGANAQEIAMNWG